jgi:hypothetical protein
MVQRAEREPTMEEIVVALRETRRGADRVRPFAVTERPRGKRGIGGTVGSSDVADLRDDEIERLLAENARLNARVVSLLKVIERDQTSIAEAAAETATGEPDRQAIYREVRATLETELGPILLVLLRLLEKQRGEPAMGERTATGGGGLATMSRPATSDWIINLMQRLDNEAPAPQDPIAAADVLPRRAKLRDRMAEILNAFRFDPIPASPRRNFTPQDGAP